ncbi:NAD(P)-binding domain-containing protein [Hymenobacter sp. BT635]|uniref:NAD(P)-binding domain-containing protein n=1 Tax=Hymenobacter nitidus TaxID=2880929 RepID=A0ABS8ABX0_9BACT|nr:NAD(P)-binding domain-containing protein [Hymenobacter nitidus]MCB2377920.1 NAD(P)-binding domain-containing protein [Hymenobacter nitidus]
MKIGIIGTGSIGATLAQKLAAAGHQVKVTNTRQPDELAQKAKELGGSPATLPEVVQDVDVVFVSIPLHAIPKLPTGLLRDLPPAVVVADTSNYYPQRDGKIDALENGQVESVWVAEQLGRPIIKAYNNILSQTLVVGGTAPGTPGRIAISVAGDNAQAKQRVAELISATGFDVVDAGSLAESWRQQPGTPAYCTDLTAPELTQALANAVPGKGPQVRDEIIAQLTQHGTPLTREDLLALNRSLGMGA